MKLLAVEGSASRVSLALFEGGRLAGGRELVADRRNSQALFDAAADLVAGAGWSFGDIEVFAAGRGPGSYMGLRMSLTAARGWALPRGRTVWAVSSAAALAAEVLSERPEREQVLVWGPSRKGIVWAGCFERDGMTRVRQIGGWQLLAEGELDKAWPGVAWVEPGRAPGAEWVGRLFLAGQAGEALEPIYLHPAVAIPPRFDAEGRPLA